MTSLVENMNYMCKSSTWRSTVSESFTPELPHCQPQSINKLWGAGSASCPQLHLPARWLYMLQGMLSCEQAHQNAGISMPNCSDACMCDRGRSTDLDEVWHVHCRNVEVLALEVMTLKIGLKRDKWIQQHKPQRARMGWVQSSKCCYPKNIATLQRPVQSQFFRWVNCSFF